MPSPAARSVAAKTTGSSGLLRTRHADSAYRLPKLPACQICHDRKVKVGECDNVRPKCLSCIKSSAECIIVRSDGGPPISREYIANLEAEANLDALPSTAENTNIVDDDDTITLSHQSESRVDDDERGQSAAITPNHRESETAPSTSLRGSGLNFMISLFSDPEWRNTHSDLLHDLTQASRPSAPDVMPNALPSEADARVHQHLSQQISSQSSLWLLFGRAEALRPCSHSRSAVRNTKPAAHRPLWYLLPYWYLSPNVLMLTHGASLGTSIWEIVRLCMRMCVEQGLHRLRSPGLDLLEDQVRRRVFWTCYLMDRYSSSILNRPFAIADRDIKAELPVDLNDCEIIAAQDTYPSLEAIDNIHSQSDPSEVSVFLHCVQLRKITSSIYSKFSGAMASLAAETQYTDDDLTSAGHTITTMDELIDELSNWQSSSPFFEKPQSLFEKQEWYELLKVRETFHVIRKAVDQAPKRDGIPSSSILALGVRWAIHLIHLYSDLFEQSIVTYTRSYFQMMITAGFFVMYYTSVTAALGASHASECRRALERCEQTLTKMAADLSDAQHYVAVFKALQLQVSGRLDQALDTANPSWDPGFPTFNTTLDTITTSQNQVTAAYQPVWNMPPMFQPNGSINVVDGGLSHTSGRLAQDLASSGLSWDFLNDDRQWNIDSYAWGDVNEAFGLFDGTQFVI
ncbi:hypothetical protein NPX13_g178 [Xylaria arbuscula]|uniref:Zn(2)-C6 fungal-type domain-containing protein n=1 Tax=Xylaria arbuscula TaxID=114810 RepID=A0A9W8NPB4_9PEZI|nr:hypothetical protein NPX13_g178 [Xylaria arbuscula]